MPNRFRPQAFGRSLRVLQPTPTDVALELKLVRCPGCRSPIARMAPGSSAQVKCRHCGAVVRVELR